MLSEVTVSTCGICVQRPRAVLCNKHTGSSKPLTVCVMIKCAVDVKQPSSLVFVSSVSRLLMARSQIYSDVDVRRKRWGDDRAAGDSNKGVHTNRAVTVELFHWSSQEKRGITDSDKQTWRGAVTLAWIDPVPLDTRCRPDHVPKNDFSTSLCLVFPGGLVVLRSGVLGEAAAVSFLVVISHSGRGHISAESSLHGLS